MSDFIQVATTTQTQEEALKIARVLVQHRLAACVQMDGPITSVYRWQGEVEQSQEWRCTIKTRKCLFLQVVQLIGQYHTYDVPEIVATEILGGSPAYEEWLDAELKAKP